VVCGYVAQESDVSGDPERYEVGEGCVESTQGGLARGSVNDEFGEHRVEVGDYDVTLPDSRVDSDSRALRRLPEG
jgi:hypothetical protein